MNRIKQPNNDRHFFQRTWTF